MTADKLNRYAVRYRAGRIRRKVESNKVTALELLGPGKAGIPGHIFKRTGYAVITDLYIFLEVRY